MPEEKLELNVSSSGVGQATRGLDGMAASLGSVNRLMTGLAGIMGGMAIGSFFKSAVDEAVKYEEQIAQIQKVTDRGVAQQMRTDIMEMAEEMPIARDELTGIVEEAGRLGVEGTDNIKQFTTTISQLSVATDIAAGDAAKDFARFSSLTQTPIDQVEQLGSVVNKLSNNMATSASEIVDSMTRAGGAASQFGLQAQNISAVTSALNEVSASARRSGTRVRRLFQEMQNPKKVKDVAAALNMQVDEFKRLQKNNPEELFLKLINRFRTSEKAADKMRQTFSSASRTAIAGLSQNVEGLQEALGYAKGQMEDATSLTREYGIQAATTKSQQQLLNNQIDNFQTKIGEDIRPFYADVLGILQKSVKEWSLIFGYATDVEKSLKEMQRVMNIDETLNKQLESLTKPDWAEFVESIPGFDIFENKNFISDEKLNDIRNRLSGTLRSAVRKDAQIGKNLVEAFSKRRDQIKKLLSKGIIDEKEAVKQMRDFMDTWGQQIAHATVDGAESGSEKAAKNLTDTQKRILQGSADTLETRLASESAKIANKFSEEFQSKFQSIKQRVESGSIDPNVGIEKLNELMDKFRDKISDATENGIRSGAESVDLASLLSQGMNFNDLKGISPQEIQKQINKNFAPEAASQIQQELQETGVMDRLLSPGGLSFEQFQKLGDSAQQALVKIANMRNQSKKLNDDVQTTSRTVAKETKTVADKLREGFSANQAFRQIEPYIGEIERLFKKAGKKVPDELVSSVRSRAKNLGILEDLRNGMGFSEFRQKFGDDTSKAVLEAMVKLSREVEKKGGNAGRRWAKQFGDEAQQVLQGTVTDGDFLQRAEQLKQSIETQALPDTDDLPAASGRLSGPGGGNLGQGLQGGVDPEDRLVQGEPFPQGDPFADVGSEGTTPTEGFLDVDAPFQKADEKMEFPEEKGLTDMEREAQRVEEMVMTPMEKINEARQRFEKLKANDLIDQETFDKAMTKTKEKYKSNLSQMEAMTRQWGQQFSQTAAKMLATGKANFRRLAQSFIQDFFEVIIQRTVTNRALNWMMGLSGGNALPTGIPAFGDTPGVMEAKNGSVVQFKEGDKFAAAQNQKDLQKQVGNDQGDQSQSSNDSKQPIRVINVQDESMVEDYMNSGSGERVVLNQIRNNSEEIKQIVG